MRQGQQNSKRMRGRNRKGPNPLTRSYESNGGDVKIRGTALHVAEKYVQLARDAQASGDRVAGENYFQHAEHYYRIVAAAQAQMPQLQPQFRSEEDGDDDDLQDNRGNYGNTNYQGNTFGGQRPPMQGNPQQGANQPAQETQPYANGGAGGGGPGGNGGGGPDQPRNDDQQGDQRFEQRGEGYDNRERGQGGGYANQGGGNFRHRRRRPYRDQYNDRGGEQRGQLAGPGPVDAGPEPQGDE